MKTIVLIGVGKLGMRHLQAISRLEDVRIIAVDPSLEAIEKAKSVLGYNFENIIFNKDMSILKENVELAIVATDSSIRKNVIKELTSRAKVKYMILEKVLFQCKEDYYEVEKILTENRIETWVNCPRRTTEFYKKLKSLYANASYVNLNITGSLWGIGCNSIHFIDLLAFLTGTAQNIVIDTKELDNEIIQSKRRGFIEFTGKLSGTLSDHYNFCLISNSSGAEPVIITINSDVVNCIINESEGTATLRKIENNWEAEKIDFRIPFQSQLTDKIVNQIFETEKCELTSYSESVKLHIPLIDSFLNKINDKEYVTDYCHIT